MGAARKQPVMTRSQQTPTLIWAIDPLEALREKPGKLQANIAELLKRLSTHFSMPIEPVYVMSSMPQPSVEFNFEWPVIYRDVIDTSVKQIVKRFPRLRLLPLKVLTQAGSSTYGAVETLSNYAMRKKAFLIIAGTHSKRGLKRFLLGSFAETLILRSSTPVIIVGPHLAKLPPLKKILFPTDFSHHSQQIFRRLVEFAKAFHADITLLHVIPFTVRPYTSGNILFPASYWGAFVDYVQATRKSTEKHGQSWGKFARKSGIQLDWIVDDRGSSSVWEAILFHAKKKRVGMIAMEAVSGPIASTVIGSVTRQVARHAECPVWTFSLK